MVTIYIVGDQNDDHSVEMCAECIKSSLRCSCFGPGTETNITG